MQRDPDDRYAVISLPPSRSGKPRPLPFPGWGLVSGIAALILVAAALTVAVIVYTPLGKSLPIADQEMETRYGAQITGIQRQLQGLAQELNTLTGYNLRGRRALGEKLSPEDSSLASAPIDTLGRIAASGEAPPMKFPLSMPAEGYLSRGVDLGGEPFCVDFAGKEGSAVTAAADGRVIFSGWTYDNGYTLMIAHAGGIVTVYKHNQSILKNTGAAVKRGELIALMGSTGRTSSGSHLHFEVWKNGIADNPQRYLLTTP